VASCLLAALLVAAAGPAAAFYGEPELREVLQLAAASMLLAPVGGSITALLRRELAFGKLALVGNAGAVTRFLVVVLLAALGFGAVSLAWALLAANLLTAVLLVSLSRPLLWIFRPSLARWREILSFGGYASINAILNVVYVQLPQLLLGRLQTFDAVGLYSRATTLCQLGDLAVLSAVQPVVLPALAQQVRSGGALKEPYLRAMTYNTALQWPFLVVLAVLADPIVRLLLGAQWSAAVPIVQITAVATLFSFPAFLTYPVLVATGRIKDTLRLNLTSLPPSFALIALAAPFGVEALAASALVTLPLQIYVALRFVRVSIPFSWRELAVAVRSSAVVTLCAAATPVVVVALNGFHADLPLPAAIGAMAGAGVGWMFGLRITRHALLKELATAARPVAELARHRARRVRFRRPRKGDAAAYQAHLDARSSPGQADALHSRRPAAIGVE
jgi:O-antigen/teichoic acid export membrane protein